MKQPVGSICVLLFFASALVARAQFFAPLVVYQAGVQPMCVRTGDFNHDGRPDLVSVDAGSVTMTVLTNTGNGGFSNSATLNVRFDPRTAAVADFNNDGWDDVACSSYGGGGVVVFLNDGSGVLVSNAVLNVSVGQWFVVAADVNGDAKPDLISTYRLGAPGNFIKVMTNDGTGIFMSYAMVSVGGAPEGIAVADLNGDNRPDLVSANYTSGTLSVLTNSGGGFVTSQEMFVSGGQVSSQPISVTAADINGDGKKDLISTDSGNNTLSIFLNNGNAFFIGRYSVAVPQPVSLAARDINGDGSTDLIVASFSTDQLYVLTNDGLGGFTPAFTLSPGDGPFSLISADLNGDGLIDLASANLNAGTIGLLFEIPQLAIATTPPNIVKLSWPFIAKGYTVQTNDDLGSGLWGDVAGLPANDGTNWMRSFNASGDNRFFRLKH